jgi:hypothetical protein
MSLEDMEVVANEEGDAKISSSPAGEGDQVRASPCMDKEEKRTRDSNIALPQRRVQHVASEMTTTSPSSDVAFAITRATELFLESLATSIGAEPKYGEGGKVEIAYHEIADIVQKDSRLTFLSDVIPQKCQLDVVFPTTTPQQ